MHLPDDMEDVVPLDDILDKHDEAEAMGKAEAKEKPQPEKSEEEKDFDELSSAVSEFDSTIPEDGGEPDLYGLEPEMGQKECGGVKGQIDGAGHMTHVMEQLEVDWKFASGVQTGDNEI